MGGGSWSSSSYNDSKKLRAASGTKSFAYHDDVATGKKPVAAHVDLDPAKAIAGAKSDLVGQNVRESRDIDGKESLPIIVLFDVTGSMGSIPRLLQEKLPKLMEVVTAKAKVEHPHILFGAIGDSTCDRVPLQISQFEADNRVDEHLRNMFLEGGGGGQDMESYALAWHFAGKHTATDAWDKRGKKGYLITMGDEAFWPTVTKEDVERIFGIKTEKDETAPDLLALAMERWEVFHLHIMQGSQARSTSVQERWRKVLGERFMPVEDAALVCEVIAGIIHAGESAQDVGKVADDLGLTGHDRDVVTNALAPLSKSTLPAHVASGGLPGGHKGSGGGVTRV